MKKTLLLSAISVAGAAALVGGMTFASFNDTQTSQFPSLVAAGTIELDQQGVTAPLAVTNMKPGDTASFTLALENEGTLDGHLYAMVASIMGVEDGCDVRDQADWADDPIYDFVRVEATVDPNCANLLSGGDLVPYLTYDIVLPGGTVVPLDAISSVDLGQLAHSSSSAYVLRVHFTDVPLLDMYQIAQQNDAQGDAATIQLKFALVQS